MKYYKRNLKPLARNLRTAQTKEEFILWHKIKNKQMLNVNFYRQKPMYGYILDFYCPKAKLAIEVDGKYHNADHSSEYDSIRDKILLECYKIKTLRFTNHEIQNFIKKVIVNIYYEVKRRI